MSAPNRLLARRPAPIYVARTGAIATKVFKVSMVPAQVRLEWNEYLQEYLQIKKENIAWRR